MKEFKTLDIEFKENGNIILDTDLIEDGGDIAIEYLMKTLKEVNMIRACESASREYYSKIYDYESRRNIYFHNECRRWKMAHMEHMAKKRNIGASYLQLRRENTDLKGEIAMLRMREGDGGLWERIKEWFRRVL